MATDQAEVIAEKEKSRERADKDQRRAAAERARFEVAEDEAGEVELPGKASKGPCERTPGRLKYLEAAPVAAFFLRSPV